MITCGIDVGIENTKIVVLKDGEVAGKAVGASGGARRADNVRNILQQALQEADIKETDIESFALTGKGKYNTRIEGKKITELKALETAVRKECPDATQVVSIGADETIVIELSDQKIEEYTLNQKCSAGIGLFLEEAEEDLQLSFHEADLSCADRNVVLNDTCVCFAGMDILERLNEGHKRETVLQAALHFAAVRVSGVMNDITIPDSTKTVLTGGVCLNDPFVAVLKDYRKEALTVMTEPLYTLAWGAACYAALN